MSKKCLADIGIIGGSGFNEAALLSNKKDIKVNTPYGAPSDLITIGEHSDMKVAFIPRHGKHHQIAPHIINSRANIWALKELGVRRIVALSTVGSLNYNYKTGHFVVPDQFIDFTKRRECTFYDGEISHVCVTEPFCTELRDIVITSIIKLNYIVHGKATYICIEGPSFSTRAESKFFTEIVNGDIIGMTVVPECALAREAGLCYASVAIVTDYDSLGYYAVNSKQIRQALNSYFDRIQNLIAQLIPKICVKKNTCSCINASENVPI